MTLIKIQKFNWYFFLGVSLGQWGHYGFPLSQSYQIPFAGGMKNMFSFVNHSFMVTGLLPLYLLIHF